MSKYLDLLKNELELHEELGAGLAKMKVLMENEDRPKSNDPYLVGDTVTRRSDGLSGKVDAIGGHQLHVIWSDGTSGVVSRYSVNHA